MRGVRCFCEAHQPCHDSGVIACRRIDEESVVHKAHNSGNRASATGFAGGTNDRNWSQSWIKEESWLGHNQIGLEIVGDRPTCLVTVIAVRVIRVKAAIEVWKGKISVG